jgi:hypothetical protein
MNRSLRTVFKAAAAATLLLASTASAATNPITLRFESKAAVATGATPGKPVKFFAVSNDSQEYFADIRRIEAVVIASAEGTARLDVEAGVAGRAVWFAVDVHAGEYAVASPGGFALRRLAWPTEMLETKHATRGDVLNIPFPEADVAIVRHDGSSWSVKATKGARHDLDGKVTGRRMLLAPSSLKKRSGDGDPTLTELRDKDLLIVVDPYSLVFFAGTIKREAK